jgi:hypothetical protein
MRGDGLAVPETTAAGLLEPSLGNETNQALPGTAPLVEVEPEAAGNGGYRWNVTRGARRLVNWSIPLGGLVFVAYLGVIIALSAGRISKTEEVTNSYNATYNVERVFAAAVTKCPTITCINRAGATAESGEVRAIADLRDNFGDTIQFQAYGDDLNSFVSIYDLMSHETTVSSVRSTLSSWQSETVKTRTDVNALLATLT